MNRLEKEIKYRGYRGFIKQNGNEYMQWRCAYVVVPKENKLYERDYDKLSLDVHGGVTFSEYGDVFSGRTEGELKTLKDDDWVLGIDFAHGGDTTGYWTLNKVEEELKHFIDEVIRVGER